MCVCVCVSNDLVWKKWSVCGKYLGTDKQKSCVNFGSVHVMGTTVLCNNSQKNAMGLPAHYSLNNKATNLFQRLRHMMLMGKCFPVCQKGIIGSCPAWIFTVKACSKKGLSSRKWMILVGLTCVKPRSEKGPSSRKHTILVGLSVTETFSVLETFASRKALHQQLKFFFWQGKG